ncbi:TRAP transporter large permease subunit [Chloroflexota bacterium]
MEWPLVLLIVILSLVILMATGFPIAFGFLLINIVGMYIFFGGEAGLSQLVISMFTTLGNFSLFAIPLFVLMGEVMFRSGLGLEVITILEKWMGRLPGRLGLLAVAAGTLFGATSGSTTASTAMLGTLLTPEMEKHGYKKPISIGTVMGSGGLAMIIPPSGFAVVLATIGEMSIGKLLIAGIVPGFIIALFYASYVILRCWLQPSVAPPYAFIPTPFREKIGPTVRMALPLALIVFMVLGFIFLGLATPTESAAFGVIGTLIMAAVYKKLKWKMLKESLLDTLTITAMILLIIAGARAFTQILAASGALMGLVGMVEGLNVAPLVVVAVTQIIVVLMGCFMSYVAIMMITLPVYIPIIVALGYDPIWFGLLMLINLEMAQTTPPFGMLLFVMKGVAPPDTTLGDVIKAGYPFLLCDAATMIIVMFFPVLALWLPDLMLKF